MALLYKVSATWPGNEKRLHLQATQAEKRGSILLCIGGSNLLPESSVNPGGSLKKNSHLFSNQGISFMDKVQPGPQQSLFTILPDLKSYSCVIIENNIV